MPRASAICRTDRSTHAAVGIGGGKAACGNRLEAVQIVVGAEALAVRCVYTCCVPWVIERDGSSLRVDISCPVDDWEVLFDEMDRRLQEEQGVSAIEMPETIPGALRVDTEVLAVIRRVLNTSGIPVRTG
jgi:hypothetical protein